MDLVDEIRLRPEAGARRLVAEYRERLYQVAYWGPCTEWRWMPCANI